MNQRGLDSKRGYSFRFDPTDVTNWKLAAAGNGQTLTEWMIRQCNAAIFDSALALIQNWKNPKERSAVLSMMSELFTQPVREEGSSNGQPGESDHLESVRPDPDLRVAGRSTGKPGRPRRSESGAEVPGANGGSRSSGVDEPVAPVAPVYSTDPELDKALRADAEKLDALQAPPPELAKQVLAKRGYCEHGVQRGYHCWQCGGKAKIGGDPEEASKKDKAKAAKKKGRR